jgi:hypothetical protein
MGLMKFVLLCLSECGGTRQPSTTRTSSNKPQEPSLSREEMITAEAMQQYVHTSLFSEEETLRTPFWAKTGSDSAQRLMDISLRTPSLAETGE